MIYWLYRFLALAPLPVSHRLADLGTWLLENVLRYRRRVIDTNLSRAFPDASRVERIKMRKDFYRHLADTTFEILHLRQMDEHALRKRVVMNNPEQLNEATNNGTRSAIVMSLHQGNWEWMLQRAAVEYPITKAAVYKKLHNAGADRFSHEIRAQFDVSPVEMREASRNILKHRRTPRLIFVIGDQSPGKRERVHWTEFLNQPTAFFSGSAALARATGFPVYFARGRREGRGQYRIDIEPITLTPKDLSEAEIIERYARLTEDAILLEPASWLWSNRRWKLAEPQPASETNEGESGNATQSKPSA